MHILVTNDDGPPHSSFSPYIKTLVDVLISRKHIVSVVVPSQQRSWIGKAHILPASTYQEPKNPIPQPHQSNEASKDGGEGQVYGAKTSKNDDVEDALRPTYLDPRTGKIYSLPKDIPEDKESSSPHYWALVPGTPATCTQLGLFHHSTLFPGAIALSSELPPVDLVLSGPNHGRNTTAAFALSSGTLGGALEAAIAGMRAIALSFAFFTRSESQELIQEACELSARIIEKLVADWDKSGQPQPDLYSINVPLVDGIGKKEVRYTWMLRNIWGGGQGLYKQIKSSAESSAASDNDSSPPVFKWAPSFNDIWKTVEESEDGNDGKTIREGNTSVTPLMANFESLFGSGDFQGTVKL